MSLSFTDAGTTLNTILGDSNDTTFSSSEKERALTRAWNDGYVTNEVWNTDLTYSSGTYRYAKPVTITSLQDIYISATGSSSPFPDPIDSSVWELVNGYIQFNSKADRVIPHGSTLYLKGRYKLTTSDEIADTNVQEYVLALAGVYTLKLLVHKKVNLFTKNDVSVSELLNTKRELEQDVTRLRQQLPRTWESA